MRKEMPDSTDWRTKLEFEIGREEVDENFLLLVQRSDSKLVERELFLRNPMYRMDR